MRERSITLGGFSKTFSITGWRIGYLLASAERCHKLGHVHDLVYVCAPASLQLGVARVSISSRLGSTTSSKSSTRASAKSCALRWSAPASAHTCPRARTTFWSIAGNPGANAKARALTLLHESGVAAVPGSAFFEGGRGDDLLRFSYAKREAELDEACRRLDACRFRT